MEEVIRRPTSHSLDRQGERYVQVTKADETGRPGEFIIFNTVLQAALEDDFKHWPEKGTGISSGDHQTDCLSNLRFADNVVFIFHIAGSAEKNNDRLQKEHRQ